MSASSQHRLLNLAHTALLVLGIAGICWLALSLLFSPATALAASAGIILAMMVSPGLSPQTVLRAYGAKRLTEREFPQALALLRELTERAGLPSVPAFYYLPTSVPNAFATGSTKNSAICVSDGLLRLLNSREFAGVLAHEVSHIAHRDLWIMGLADMMSRAVSLASYAGQFLLLINLPLFLFGLATVPWLVPLILIFAPTLVSLLQLALSRSREFDADRGAADLLGTGRPLASALRRIEAHAAATPMEVQPQQAYAYIHNPLAEFGRGRRRGGPDMARLFSTHPSTDDRIARLTEMNRRRGSLIS